MELRQLRYFLAVCRTMNFTRAAEEMHIAQPPLSRQVSHLEDELGVRLIDRDARPMRLTSSGEFFKERAQEIVSRIDRLKAETIAVGRGGRQTHRIGFETSVLYGYLPAVIKHLRALNPHLDIDLRALSTPDQVAAIREGTVDVGVGRERIADDQIEQVVIRQEPFVVALYPSHPLAANGARALRFTDLACDTIISYSDQSARYSLDPVSRLMDRANFAPARKIEIRDLLAALGLVAAEAGVCIVPATVQRMRSTDVCYYPLDEDGATSSILLNFIRGSPSPIVHQTQQVLAQLLQSTGLDHDDG